MRTEEQIVSMAPIKVRLGTTDYEIALLPVVPQAKWRDQMNEAMQPILQSFSGELTVLSFSKAYGVAIRESPKVITDLIFAYANNLDRAQIEATATEEQLSLVFTAIMEVAFPFTKPLEMVTRLTANRSQ